MSDTTEVELRTRVHRQEVIAELGQRALDIDDVDELMHEAADAIVDTLDTEYSGVFELESDRAVASLRAGVGWRDGLVGSTLVSTDEGTQYGQTLAGDEPVVVEDVQAGDRFARGAVLASHDVAAGLSVGIGSAEDPWGILATHDTDSREFDENDVAFLQSIANVVASAIESDRATRTLERTLDLLEKTERTADVGGWEIDAETMEVFWTDHLYDMLGVPRDQDPTVEEALEVYHDTDRERVVDAIENALEHGEPIDLEARIRTGSEEVRWLHVQGVPVLDDGEVVTLRGAAQDVTARKRNERELEQHQALTEAANDVIITIDGESTIHRVNPAISDVFGYEQDDLVGKPLTALMPQEYKQRHLDGLGRYLETGERTLDWEYVELPGLHADGSSVPLAISFSEIEYEDETYFTGVLRDITDRKRRERELERSERRYRTLVDHFPNGAVALYDHDLRYTAAGGQLLEDLYGDVEDPVGERVVDRLPDDVAEDIEPPYRAALEGESTEFEIEHMDRHLLVRTIPVRNPDDGVEGGMVVVLDITERREYQKDLEASHERLKEFATAVSHDLKKPLATVASYLQLLEHRYDDELDEEAEEFIDFAVDSATRMQQMIDGLVSEYARIDSDRDSFQPTDLDAILEDVLVDLDHEITESDADVTSEQLPRVHGDPGQLHQLFLNLVENAIKYAGEDPPRIHVSAEQEDDGWRIAVRDEGIGIDTDDTEEVFEVFHRLHDETHSGTGIGLALCRRIVNRHDGDIWVESDPGEGSTFYITIPDSVD